MRKINPADVRADFESSLAELNLFYDTAYAAIQGERDSALNSAGRANHKDSNSQLSALSP